MEKLQANEITGPLAFTICKLELHGKAIVLQSPSRHTETKVPSFARTKTNQGASAAVRVQGRTCFSCGQQRTKQKEESVLLQNKNKPRRKCCSMVSRRHLFRTSDEESDDEE